MEFKKYQHVEKLSTSEVEGILNGTVYLFYKIDGTNGCIFLKENFEVGFGSRNRELSLSNDNAEFMNSVCDDFNLYSSFKNYLIKHPNHIIYGEWLVPNHIKRYKDDAWKKFYVFDVYDCETNCYLDYETYTLMLDEFNIMYIPYIKILENPTKEEVLSYLDHTKDYLLSSGMGEGIVIKNYEYKNLYGRSTWAKVLTSDYLENKVNTRNSNHQNKIDNIIEYKIISKYLTIDFINKEFYKYKEENNEFNSKDIFILLNRVFIEFYKDNWELILKAFKYPTINFKTLKRLSDNKIKDVLGL